MKVVAIGVGLMVVNLLLWSLRLICHVLPKSGCTWTITHRVLKMLVKEKKRTPAYKQLLEHLYNLSLSLPFLSLFGAPILVAILGEVLPISFLMEVLVSLILLVLLNYFIVWHKYGDSLIAWEKRLVEILALCLTENGQEKIIDSGKSAGEDPPLVDTERAKQTENVFQPKAQWLLFLSGTMFVVGIGFLVYFSFEKIVLSSQELHSDTFLGISHFDLREIAALAFVLIGLIPWKLHDALNPELQEERKKKKKEEAKDSTEFSYDDMECLEALCPGIQKGIESIAKKFKMERPRIQLCNDEKEIARADVYEGVPFVTISQKVISTFPRSLLLFVMGHEITHLFFKDYRRSSWSIEKKLIVCEIVILLLMIVFFLLFPGALLSIVYAFMLLIFVVLDFIVFRTVENPYFYCQMHEFRADRYGYQMANMYQEDSVDPQAIKWAFDVLSSPVVEEKKGFLARMFILANLKNPDEDLHPYPETRVRELEEYGNRPWSIFDVIRFVWIFMWKCIQKKEVKL